MTQKQAILNVFKRPTDRYTCTAICTLLFFSDFISFEDSHGYRRRSLMASVSSQLSKFVKEKVLRVVPDAKGQKGGMVYEKVAPISEETANKI
jgi:hypothetical protein